MKAYYITISLICATFLVCSCGPPKPPHLRNRKKNIKESEKVTAVEKGPLRSIVSTTGRVVANLEVEIKCKASGEVQKLPFDVSDEVKKGKLLVQLDPINEKRTVQRAEVSLAVSKAKLAQAKLNLEIAEKELITERTRADATMTSAKARAVECEAKYKRSKQLVSSDTVSREEYEADRTAHVSAQADLAEAQARIEDLKSKERAIEVKKQDVVIAKAQVESDEISLSDATQRLRETTVSAPMDGVVVSREVQVGQIISSGISNVGGGTTILTLADLSRTFILASVDESDIGRVQIGQRAFITADAYQSRRFFGEVVRIAAKGVNTSNVVTFEVKIELKGRSRYLLKPEMTTNIEIIVGERESALLIPVEAVRRHRRKLFVSVRKEGTDEDREVTIGINDGQKYEVLSGLTEGELLVSGGKGKEQSRWRKSSEDARNKRRKQRMGARMMGAKRRRK